jgi:hypothetical protein
MVSALTSSWAFTPEQDQADDRERPANVPASLRGMYSSWEGVFDLIS